MSFILFTSLRSCHRRCPTCHGPLPPDDLVSGCLQAAELCPSWPSQTSLWCRKPAASTLTLSETPGPVEKGREKKRFVDGNTTNEKIRNPDLMDIAIDLHRRSVHYDGTLCLVSWTLILSGSLEISSSESSLFSASSSQSVSFLQASWN